MLTYYCPNCWMILRENEKTCSDCGYILKEFEKLTYEDKLLAALYHPLPERRMMAAQILGIRKCQRALPEFHKIIIGKETDYYFLRTVLLATAMINHPDRNVILQKATRHNSQLVANYAKMLLAQLSKQYPIDNWDRHTG